MKFLLGAALAACILVAPALAQHAHGPAAPAGQADPAAPEARMADIAAFRTDFFARDNAYTPAARAEAETRLARLEADPAALSQTKFELEIARIVALADNGHTWLFANPLIRHVNHAPIGIVPFGEDFYVVRAPAAHADLLGARLVAIDETPIDAARAAARTLIGGVPGWRDRWIVYALESPAIMHAFAVAAAPDAALYVFETADGARLTRRLEGAPLADDAEISVTSRRLAPAPMRGEGADWRTLLAAEDAPWALRDFGAPFRWRDAPELDALVVQFRANVSSEAASITDFITEIEARRAELGRANFVIDMRFNGGGDLTTTRRFMSDLPGRVPGRIFVLTSPWTFSAGISSTAYVKQAAPDRVTIVGEEVGDRLEFWAEGQVARLPNSGLRILYATERHDYRNGCRAYADCHRFVVDMPIAVETLAPDVAAPWTIEAYRAGRDPAMEAVAAALSH